MSSTDLTASVIKLAHDLGLSEPTIRRAITLGDVKAVSRGHYSIGAVKIAVAKFVNEPMAVGHATSGRGRLEAAQIETDGEQGTFATLSQAKSQNERLKSERLQLDLDIRRGAYVKKSDVTTAGLDIVRRATAHFLAIGERAAPRLTGLTDQYEIQEILEEEARKSLNQLADITRLVDEILE